MKKEIQSIRKKYKYKHSELAKLTGRSEGYMRFVLTTTGQDLPKWMVKIVEADRVSTNKREFEGNLKKALKIN